MRAPHPRPWSVELDGVSGTFFPRTDPLIEMPELVEKGKHSGDTIDHHPGFVGRQEGQA